MNIAPISNISTNLNQKVNFIGKSQKKQTTPPANNFSSFAKALPLALVMFAPVYNSCVNDTDNNHAKFNSEIVEQLNPKYSSGILVYNEIIVDDDRIIQVKGISKRGSYNDVEEIKFQYQKNSNSPAVEGIFTDFCIQPLINGNYLCRAKFKHDDGSYGESKNCIFSKHLGEKLLPLFTDKTNKAVPTLSMAEFYTNYLSNATNGTSAAPRYVPENI